MQLPSVLLFSYFPEAKTAARRRIEETQGLAAEVDAATLGSYEFTEMPLPPKRRRDSG